MYGSSDITFASCTLSSNSLPAVKFSSSFTGTFLRINMDDADFQSSLQDAPTPQACSSSAILCADNGYPGSLCDDRSPSSLGVKCAASPDFPYISALSSSDCLNNNGNVYHLNGCPTSGATVTISGLYFNQSGTTAKSVQIGDYGCSITA